MRKTGTILDPKTILLAALRAHGVQEQEYRLMLDHLATASISWYTKTYGRHIGTLMRHWGNTDKMLGSARDCPLCQ